MRDIQLNRSLVFVDLTIKTRSTGTVRVDDVLYMVDGEQVSGFSGPWLSYKALPENDNTAQDILVWFLEQTGRDDVLAQDFSLAYMDLQDLLTENDIPLSEILHLQKHNKRSIDFALRSSEDPNV